MKRIINKFLNILNSEEFSNLERELSYNKVLVFNLGFDKKSKYIDEHWIYVPDKEINFYRIGFYDNILSTDRLSMYIEIGYGKNDNITDDEVKEQLEKTLENLKKMGIIDDSYKLLNYVSIILLFFYYCQGIDNKLFLSSWLSFFIYIF